MARIVSRNRRRQSHAGRLILSTRSSSSSRKTTRLKCCRLVRCMHCAISTETLLQVTVWGDYGRMERKVFMGVAQILLDDLDLSNLVIGWYKLFTSSSLVNAHAAGSTGGAASAPGGAAPTSSSASGTVRRNSGSSLESAYQSSSTRS